MKSFAAWQKDLNRNYLIPFQFQVKDVLKHFDSLNFRIHLIYVCVHLSNLFTPLKNFVCLLYDRYVSSSHI